ncbi:protein spire homolog 1-like isoform X2 [Apostichopus japonicus]|uniref:protein spire homolog 1-like isoform X2 n=1 Tax=Stichopus japonicus TaxID=307972 RepID=UPI003AB56FB9
MDGIRRIRTNSIGNVPCVDLGDILSAFSAPFIEEQAWGLCYQCASWLRGGIRREGIPWLVSVNLESVSDILLFKDGQVRVKVGSEQPKERSQITEHQLVKLLGQTIYSCLDYGLGQEEERVLSESLETLIMQMTSATEDEDSSLNADEGIVDGHETDSCEDDDKIETISQVIKSCSKHVANSMDAATHYQAVCRALYAEVEELKSFLSKISSSNQILKKLAEEQSSGCIENHIEDLLPQEWGRIWIQCLRDLRQGIRLNKVSTSRVSNSIEYELTPYEILMDDIRSRRFSLKKVEITDHIPRRVKKEAHEIILDFIRSRPPLKKVPEEEREQSRGESQHERVMREIRSRPNLKPVSERKISNRKPRKKKVKKLHHDDSSSSGSEYDYSYLDSPEAVKKKIEPGLAFSWSASETENDTEEEEPMSPDGFHLDAETRRKLIGMSSSLEGAPDISPTHSSVSSFDDIQSIDFCIDSPRRHSVSLCQMEPWWKPFEGGGGGEKDEKSKYLSLNVDEVVHIRSVLVKAELENMRINPKLLEAVISEKVCFCCTKKFSLFGRRCRCRLCSRQVCSLCSTKMLVPKETFLSFPVEALSPTSSPKRTPTRKPRSLSEPPIPKLHQQASSSLIGQLVDEDEVVHTEDVCIQCRDFLRQALNSQTRGGLPTSPSFERDLHSKVRFQLPDDDR